jgi:phospholipid transport system transporter-binding protein
MQLPATLTLEQAAATSRALDAAAASDDAGSGPLTVDASALTAFDTSAIAVLMQARRAALAAGRGFEIAAPPPKLVQLAALYGVAELLGLASAPSSA